MMKRYFGWAAAIAIVLFQVPIPGTAMALERWLVPDVSQCASDTTINPCYTTLQNAVAQAVANDSIRILPGTYPANVTLNQNVTIFGEETARTFLTGNGGTTITVSNVTSLTDIRNITFINASPAILVSGNSSSINIKNNIFEVLNTATAIQVSGTSNPLIMNNTFYQNGTAIQSTPTTLTIINNIFSGNALAISSNVAITNILSNIFSQNSSIGPSGILFDVPGTIDYQFNDDIQGTHFVNPTANNIPDRDFHLLSTTTSTNVQGNSQGGINSINAVSPPDLGAYGGSSSDTIPFVVSNVSGTATSATSVSLTWDPNNCYMIKGYNVYYNVNQGPPYTNAVDAGNVTTFPLDVTSLVGSTPTLTAPGSLAAAPVATGTLSVGWDAVSGATGYEVSYKKVTDSTFIILPITPSPSVTLSGLEDSTAGGVPIYYDISVRATYQASVHAAVKSYYEKSSPAPPALNTEEALAFSTPDAIISLGTPTFGPSSSIQAFAESIVPNPDLPNKGCFIATAAYGYYSAPQVQALRAFRDQYLMASAPGRAFVDWYYRYGPIGAEFINAHSWLKPVVRTALMPAVGGALFMTRTSLLTKAVVLILAGALSGVLMRRRKHVYSGGVH
jgi:hypothetical protein